MKANSNNNNNSNNKQDLLVTLTKNQKTANAYTQKNLKTKCVAGQEKNPPYTKNL